MDPITLAVGGLILLGKFISRSEVRSARSEAELAQERLRAAKLEAEYAFRQAAGAASDLDTHREVCASWLSRRALSLLSYKKNRSFGRALGKTACEKLRQMSSKTRRLLSMPTNLFGRGATVAAASAVTIDILQLLDHAGVIDAPIFHETLAEVVSDIPFENATDVASSLGGIGDLAVADLIGDAMLVFSVFRIFQNAGRADRLRTAASTCDENASYFRFRAAGYLEMSDKFGAEKKDLMDNAYNLYRWLLLVESAASEQRFRKASMHAWLSEKLDNAAQTWLASLASARTAAGSH